MGSLTSLLNLAQQSLLADQSALNVTSNNVANQNTAGYTREVVSWQPSDADGVIAHRVLRNRGNPCDGFVFSSLTALAQAPTRRRARRLHDARRARPRARSRRSS